MALDGSPIFRCLTMAEVSESLRRRGWTLAAASVSIRLPHGAEALVTAGQEVARIRVADATAVGRSPSSASAAALHAALYRVLPRCNAVVHAQPPVAMAIAARAWRRGADEVRLGEDAFAVPVRGDLTDMPTSDTPPALLVAGYGATTWGTTLEIALHRLERLEHLCQQSLLAGVASAVGARAA
jgi:ribulose-5-phosphate 4-epimerase/fuculose-1-phosphate aldolase